MYIYSIWSINHGHYPYKWLWTYAGDKFFEAEGEIKFSPVYAHDLLLLTCASGRRRVPRPGQLGRLRAHPASPSGGGGSGIRVRAGDGSVRSRAGPARAASLHPRRRRRERSSGIGGDDGVVQCTYEVGPARPGPARPGPPMGGSQQSGGYATS